MRDLFSQSDFRELQVLMTLFEEKKWWTVQQIAEFSNCSMDTVYSMITKINDFSCLHGQTYSIEIRRRKGVYLHIDAELSISTIYALYLYHSTRYKILDELFQVSDTTMTKLSAKFFLSKSTIYRELLAIKAIFAATTISFDSATLKIHGDELLIRHFMLNMYFPVLNHVTWPFQTLSEDLIAYRKKEYFSSLDWDFKPIDSLKFSCQLAINFLRHQNNNFITHFPTASSVEPVRKKIVLPLNAIYANSIPTQYCQNELDYLATFGSITNALNESSQHTHDAIEFHSENNSSAFQLSKLLIHYFNEIYCQQVDFNEPHFLLQILSFATYSPTYPKLKLDNELMQDLLGHFSKESPYLIDTLRKISETIYELLQYNDKLINQTDFILEFFFLLSDFFDITVLERPILVKIATNHPAYEGTMKRALQKKVGLNLVIETSHNPIKKNVIYDLALLETNNLYESKLTAKNSYTWLYPPSQRDWEKIDTLLNQISHEKNNKFSV